MVVRIAFDIGGTFTDFVLENTRDGKTLFGKTLTTSHDVSQAVISGIRKLLDDNALLPSDIDELYHATTAATNAILERKGAKTALLTTRGFRDVVLIGRQKRYDPFDLYMRKPTPLVQRRNIYELDERILYDGQVEKDLDLKSVDAAVDEVKASGAESIAVSLLHSYANPKHEQAVAARVRELAKDMPISISSDVSSKIREYERTNTVVANAYVKPIVARYVSQLKTGLHAEGIDRELHIMQSNGGLVTPEIASEFPIRIVESGPAAGVLMCRQVAAEEGFPNALSFDMGGTTAKIGAIDSGEPAITSKFEVDAVHYRPYSGLPLNIAAIELLEIGSGGGSIASTDGRTLLVGPSSAGSNPGPICYGRGGAEPTLTDANLVLGYLDPDYFNGGAMPLDVEAARKGINDRIARPLGLTLIEAAWGIHSVANSNMERAIRVVSVERGRDPRKYCLVAFGGAGPIHATRIATSFAIPKVIVPLGAGVGSAVGLLKADARVDVSRTHVVTIADESVDAIKGIYEVLQRTVENDLAKLGSSAEASWIRYAHMRYSGQGFEIRVMLPSGPINGDYPSAVRQAFKEAYEREFGYADPNAAIEAIDWSMAVVIPKSKAGATAYDGRRALTGRRVRGVRMAYFPEAGGMITCQVISRSSLQEADLVGGPAIIEDPETSMIVGPRDTARLSPSGHVMITIGGSARP